MIDKMRSFLPYETAIDIDAKLFFVAPAVLEEIRLIAITHETL